MTRHLAIVLMLGMIPSVAHADGVDGSFAALGAVRVPAPSLAGDPGCNGGAERCTGASHAFAGSVVLHRIPTSLGPVAVVGQGWGMSFRDDRVDVSQGIAALGLRGWAGEVFWIQAGVGAAAGEVSTDALALAPAVASAITPAAMVGVGVELAADEHLELDLSVHAGSALDVDPLRVFHVSVGLGLRWY